jgi:hypothetical protein
MIDVIPLYITAQNAAVIFRKHQSEFITFESFEASLPNETVMSTLGKVVMQFPSGPRLPVSQNAETLETVSNLLSFFENTNQTEDALATTHKGGAVHPEVRDAGSPRYISEAMAGFLRAISPVSTHSIQTSYIQKRLDDHILWSSAYKPWRRAAIWLVIRVALQSTINELGLKEIFGYKVFQAFFMAHLLDEVLSAGDSCASDDIIYLMNAKLARRLWKMKDLVDSNTSPHLKFAAEKVAHVSVVLEKRWESIQRRCIRQIRWTPPSTEDISKSLQLSLLKSNCYLYDVMGRNESLKTREAHHDIAKITEELLSSCSNRLSREQVNLPEDIQGQEPLVGLHDFEAWVAYRLPDWSKCPTRSERDCPSLASIMDRYLSLARDQYYGQPERLSIMYLCLMELWVALDTLAINWCPLLKDYSPPLRPDPLDVLLLPSLAEMQRLSKVQSYLRQRYADNQTDLSPFGNINNPKSFPNRFFETSHHLQARKSEIQRWAETTEERKVAELARKNQQYHDLTSQSSNLDCQRKPERGPNGSQRMVHLPRQCKKCSLEAAASQLRITPYENPLPDSSTLAQPIVFELDCPETYGVWRNQTYQLILLMVPPEKPEVDVGIYPLSSYEPLAQFNVCTLSSTLALASTAKSIARSHYGAPRRVPAKDEEIILPHAGKFQLFDTLQKTPPRKAQGKEYLQSVCALQLDVPYTSMQSFLSGVTHTPNSVIASQTEAPSSVSTAEYIAFGHLRSGNRIQWHNILRALITHSLSFSQPSVYSLIMQSIWQAGSQGEDLVYREAHIDLMDKQLGEETITELRVRMNAIGDNWRESLLLAVLVALAVRLHSLTPHPEIADIAISFLFDARRMALGWLQIMAEKANNGNDGADFQMTAAVTAAVCRSTFHLDPEAITKLFGQPENVVTFVYSATFIANVAARLDSFSHGHQLLFRRDQCFSYKLEGQIASAIEKCPNILNMIAEKLWNDFPSKLCWSNIQSPGQRWWQTTTPRISSTKSQHVCINTISGTLLIDGKTLGRLPTSYLSHTTYREIFDSSVGT